MSLGSFIKKQFIDVLQWNEEKEGDRKSVV